MASEEVLHSELVRKEVLVSLFICFTQHSDVFSDSIGAVATLSDDSAGSGIF